MMETSMVESEFGMLRSGACCAVAIFKTLWKKHRLGMD
jgi:hypothetical protein